jgi:hypothetical protein
LTAPDIDTDTFVHDIAPAIVPTAKRVTLYASSKDMALAFSKTVHGYDRAGESGEKIVLLDGVDTIDVSAIDTNLVGHFYYGDNRSVLSDMFNLIKGQPAMDRFGLKKRTKDRRPYWVFSRRRSLPGSQYPPIPPAAFNGRAIKKEDTGPRMTHEHGMNQNDALSDIDVAGIFAECLSFR